MGRRPAGRPRRGDGTEHVVAGGPGESVVPAASGARTAPLWFFSDRTDFWSCTAGRPHERAELVVDVGGDIGRPAVGVRAEPASRCLDDGRVVVRLRPRRRSTGSPSCEPDGGVRELDVPVHDVVRYVTAQGDGGRLRRRRPGRASPVVLRVDVDGAAPEVAAPAPRPRPRPRLVLRARARRRSRPRTAAPGSPRRTRSSTRRPTRSVTAPDGERPPLLVVDPRRPDVGRRARCSTSASSTGPRRGFGVVDVDYRGSTGYGRRVPRRCCRAAWGVVDVDDCVAVRPVPRRRGPRRPGPAVRSAAGRPAATRRWPRSTCGPTSFTAGASHYGVADLGALAARHAQVRVAATSTGSSGPWPEAPRRLRRALADQPRRRVRHARWSVFQGARGRGRAARPGRDDRRRAPGEGRAASPTCCSRASSTASARPRTSARRWTASCRSTPRCGASTSPAPRASRRSRCAARSRLRRVRCRRRSAGPSRPRGRRSTVRPAGTPAGRPAPPRRRRRTARSRGPGDRRHLLA